MSASSKSASLHFFARRGSAFAAAHASFSAPVTAAPGDAFGPEFQVNTTAEGLQLLPGAGCDAVGECLIDWISQAGPDSSTNQEIRARRFAFDGTPLGPDFSIVTSAPSHALTAPRTVVDARGDFVVSWVDTAQPGKPALLRWFRPDGTPRSATVSIENGSVSGIAMDPDGDTVVLVTTGFCPSLYIGSECLAQLQARRYTVDGKFRDTRLVTSAVAGVLGTGTYIDADTVAVGQDGSFIVGWIAEEGSGRKGYQQGVVARAYTEAGKAVGPAFVVAPMQPDAPNSVRPEITSADGSADHYVVTWTLNSAGSSGRALRGDGTMPGAIVSVPFPVRAGNLSDRFVIQGTTRVFSPTEGSQTSLYAGLIGADLSALSPVVPVGTTPVNERFNPQSGIDGFGNFLVTWYSAVPNADGRLDYDVFAQRFSGE